jgi:hypothetical protein
MNWTCQRNNMLLSRFMLSCTTHTLTIYPPIYIFEVTFCYNVPILRNCRPEEKKRLSANMYVYTGFKQSHFLLTINSGSFANDYNDVFITIIILVIGGTRYHSG